jgi:glycine/D-amino acid oxidase-like deaminating enzyme
LVASGQYRNGILFAPAVVEILAGLILERPTDFAAFDPRRFTGLPFGQGERTAGKP